MLRYLPFITLLGFAGNLQEINWKEIQSDIGYLNSQHQLFSKVEAWKEGTMVESVLMDSIIIQNFDTPEKVQLAIYHSGSFDPGVTNIPLKRLDSVSNDNYLINLHVSEKDSTVYSFRYRKLDLFQGNSHNLYFVIERFERIINFYKNIN